MKIRAVGAEDRSRWEELFSAYAGFYQTTVQEGAFDRVWAWIFDTANDFWCDLVEDEDGSAIGFVQYQLMHRSLSAPWSAISATCTSSRAGAVSEPAGRSSIM